MSECFTIWHLGAVALSGVIGSVIAEVIRCRRIRRHLRGPGGGFHTRDCGTRYRGCSPDCMYQLPEED